MLGCSELLILFLVGLLLIILFRRPDLGWLGGKIGRLFRWARRTSALKLLLTSFFLGFLALVLSEKLHKPGHGFAKLMFTLFFISAIALFVWGMHRLLGLSFLGGLFAPCPTDHRLKDFLAERLPSEERGQLAAHLENCTLCQQRIEELTARPHSWPGMARKLSDRPPAPEPALRKVMARLKDDQHEGTRDEPAFAGDLPLDFLTPSDKPGQLGRLERYEVLEEIGRGGMGVVLKAFDPSLHRVVAIKVLAPQLATSGVARKRFLREAKAAAAVTHDHIVTIHSVDEANGLPYLVMQYVAGQSLQQRIDKDGPLELADILRIGMQTASGLAAAHAHGIVHRDIKPGNILLEDGVQRVKITDFGLARAMDDASLTQSGFVAGSPLYMAPEQARGEALDHRADLFSLGSVLYTMCTGRPPFRAANTLAVLRRVSEDSPRPIRETNPEIPDWLADVIDRLMAKEPAERFASAGEVVELLGQRLAQLQQGAWTPPPAASAPPPGLPTSVTICPSCGASLHVPESLVGGLVHCAECGKPFHVEDTSEVMQVARPVRWPINARERVRRNFPRKVRIALGCLIVLVMPILMAILLIILYAATREPSRPAMVATTEATRRQGAPGPPFWKNAVGELPAEATLFGAIDLKPFGSLTLEDEWTRTLLHLAVPRQTADRMTPENLGRLRLDGIALGYYKELKPKDSRAIVHLSGVALDGYKRIAEYIRLNGGENVQIDAMAAPVPGSGAVHIISSPDLPFALGILDDYRAFVTASLDPDAKPAQHRKILEQIPSTVRIPNGGYMPPWIKTALSEIPHDACGFFLGEIPADWRKLLTDSLQLRTCPRTFLLHAKKEKGGLDLTLTLNLDKAGMEANLWQDLRQRGLAALEAKYPVLKKEPQALARIEQELKMARGEARPGSKCVRIQARIHGPTAQAVQTLLKRMAQPDRK